MLNIDVCKQFPDLLLQFTLELPAQGVSAIFGLSGAGKSTLINMVGGLLQPDQGKVILNDRTLFDSQAAVNLPPERRNMGFVFQDARLFPHYRVQGNLLYGMKKHNRELFDEVVDLLGLGALLKRYPNSLSGGEKQRVAIGRALLSQPDLLLMDEPLSALDLPRKQELLDYLETLTKQINTPILYVSHSLDELRRLADRVVLLDQGKVARCDSLENLWQSDYFARWRELSKQL